MTNVTTRKEKLLQSFENGAEYTANQIASRFALVNPTAMITNLRKDGYAIYANQRTNRLGDTYTKYRLGVPTRQMIAAGYAVLGADQAGLTK
jgi:Mn-dependent DtxR family transcriptional regulator